LFADVLFALPSAEIGIEQSSSSLSVKVQHIIFRQAVQSWMGSYQIRMIEMTEAEILDRNKKKSDMFCFQIKHETTTGAPQSSNF
jgi:hypothetical protein